MTKDERWLLEEKSGGFETPEFKADCNRLASGEPVAYVIGWQPFLGLKIYLDSKPLIPRPETEMWVDQLLKRVLAWQLEDVSERDGARDSKFSAENYAYPKAAVPGRFLDLCAGSGAIGCAALARLPNAAVYFGEIDPAHEKTMLKNIRENDLDASRADIRIGDLFEPFKDPPAGGAFDIIAINPPYIPTDRVLPDSVARYEPAKALRAGTDGLDLICRIASELPRYLAPGGQAWIECDSAHAETAAKLFVERGLQAQLCTDQYQMPRYIVVSDLPRRS